jgi:AraC-like DNA-binding protein
MMTVTDMDLVARGGALSLLVLLTAILLRDHRRALPAQLAIGLIAGVACNVIAEANGLLAIARPFNIIFLLGEASISGLFWLFVRSWFNDEARIDVRSWLIIGFLLVLSLVNFSLWQPGTGNYWPTDVPMRLLWLGLAIAGLWAAWKGRGNDLVEARRRLRIGFVWATGSAVVLVNLVYYATNLVSPTKPLLIVSLSISLTIVATVGALTFAMMAIARTDIFAPIAPVIAAPVDDEAGDALAARIVGHIETTMGWRDETLTIAGLAAQLGEQEYRVRRAINARLGYRNFAAFLNQYRLTEVKAALADPTQRDVPIITIALDAGFGSLGTFNRSFREAEAMTPSEFRAKQSAP